MSKSIIVIDTPHNCCDCPFVHSSGYIPKEKPFTYKRMYSCMFEPEHYDEDGDIYTDFLNEYIIEKRKPDWCPLRKLPDKKNNLNQSREIVGYNKCLDEILGG